MIGETISRFIESADRSRFQVNVLSDAGQVMADPERLALTLACLIDNALKFSPETEPVTISTRRDGPYVLIGVQDHGRRIPEAEADRVFASFYQVESPAAPAARRVRGGPLPGPPAGRADGRAGSGSTTAGSAATPS